MGKRRLLFFLDGSSNSVANPSNDINTNIFRLNRAFTYGFSDVPQIAFYFSGVGTRGDPWSAATGRGFDQTIAEAYVNLSSNYMEGDTIYLFGFSRGAAAARALTGLVSDPGLLPFDELENFPRIWKYFISHHRLGAGEREKSRDQFQSIIYKNVSITFLGAFDTVAGTSWDSLNLFTKVRFHSMSLDKSVKHAVQILAIDDNRIPSFSPLLWEDAQQASGQTIEHIWMPGVHADIGGSSDGRFLGNVALLTMIDRARQYCSELEWDTGYIAKVCERISESRVLITNERSGLARQFLLRGDRKIGTYKSELIHPIYHLIINKETKIRGKVQLYKPKRFERELQTAPINTLGFLDIWQSVLEK